MKAKIIHQFGASSVFKTVNLSKPIIKSNHVIVKIYAVSVNPIDYKLRSGMFPELAPDFPAILHGDFSGIIEEVADDVRGFNIGDEVYGCAGGVKGESGALAEYMLVDSDLIAKKPKSLTMLQAAALPLVAITAWEALFEKVTLSPGKKVLIHAGTGGVGHVALQLAKWAGAEVYATVSSPEKAKIAKSLGASDIIYYRDESVKEYIERLTNGQGFDVILDTIGGDNIDKSMQAIAHYGNIITLLSHSTHDLSLLFSKSASLHVVFMLLPMLRHQQRKRHGEILDNITKLADEGKVKPLIDPKQFSLDEVDKAHDWLESGKATGKIVINMNEYGG